MMMKLINQNCQVNYCIILDIAIGMSDHSLLRKDSKKFKDIPTSLVPKLVGSNLR